MIRRHKHPTAKLGGYISKRKLLAAGTNLAHMDALAEQLDAIYYDTRISDMRQTIHDTQDELRDLLDIVEATE